MTGTAQSTTVKHPYSDALPPEPLVFTPAPAEHPTRRLWTHADYHKAGELGLFGPEEQLELINGEVWHKARPRSAAHAFATILTGETLRSNIGPDFHVQEEKPVVLDDLTEPEPNIMVVRGTRRQMFSLATPANAVLVVEVSETTLRFDQTVKAEAYARSGIADYWILNLRFRQLEVRREPGLLGDGQWGYRSLQIILSGSQISPLAAPDVVINVADLLPAIQAVSAADASNRSMPLPDDQAAVSSDAPQNE